MKSKLESRLKRRKGIRKNISGTADIPRLSVFRSNKHIYAQLVDDAAGVTLAGASDAAVKTGTASEKAEKVGAELAKKAKSLKITKVVFDRGGYKFHGRVKALAEGARSGGLQF